MHLKIYTLILILLCATHTGIHAQLDVQEDYDIELYGSIWLTNTYNFESQDPDWKDVLRPSRLLDDNGEPYGPDGNYNISVRPTILGIKIDQKEALDPIKFCFEFDLLGGGANVGETFFRLRRLYFQWKGFTLGQHNSLFMDASVIPNTVEYFAPNGMALVRNIQLSYMPIKNDRHELALGIENPSVTSDLGPYDREFAYGEALDNVDFVTKLPAFTGHYRYTYGKGHMQMAWTVKHINWEDKGRTAAQDLSGSEWGVGASLTGLIDLSPKLRILGSFTTGRGVQNFINDGTSDLGVRRDYNSTYKPILGKAIPFFSYMFYNEVKWSKKWRTTIGISQLINFTFPTQLSTSYESGTYATAGFIYNPHPKVGIGLEYQYGDRQNTIFHGDRDYNLPFEFGNFYAANQIQLLVSYNFSTKK